jgi:predicted RNase H-like HicB family nuclease
MLECDGMEVAYTYWEAEDGLLVGYLNDYPDHLTQGHDLDELEEMLADVYQIRQEEEVRLAQKRKNGVLRIKVPARNARNCSMDQNMTYTKTREQTGQPKFPAMPILTNLLRRQ